VRASPDGLPAAHGWRLERINATLYDKLSFNIIRDIIAAALSALAGLGCGVAATQGDLLFVALFAAATVKLKQLFDERIQRFARASMASVRPITPWRRHGHAGRSRRPSRRNGCNRRQY
jgi:hypothetical protein